jgi:hypothetical protein
VEPSGTPAEDTKVAAVEESAAEVKPPEAPEPASPPLPETVSREELTQDIVAELKRLECYRGPIDGKWRGAPQEALRRFNDLSKLELPLEEPEQSTLDSVKG